jgi:low affinity Fe/Cu permease
MREVFRRFAHLVSMAAGSVTAFLLALTVIVIWAVTGPLFGFSDTWQLVINTGTTIVTFLMVFLIQNTQNRDSQALHAKLDDLLIAVKEADNALVEAENLSDEDLEQVRTRLQSVARDGNGGEQPLAGGRTRRTPRVRSGRSAG